MHNLGKTTMKRHTYTLLRRFLELRPLNPRIPLLLGSLAFLLLGLLGIGLLTILGKLSSRTFVDLVEGYSLYFIVLGAAITSQFGASGFLLWRACRSNKL